MWLKNAHGDEQKYRYYTKISGITRLEIEYSKDYSPKYNAVTEHYDVFIYDKGANREWLDFETKTLAERFVKNLMYVIKGSYGSMLLKKPVILTVKEVLEMNFEEDE